MINNRVTIQLLEKNIGYLDVKEGTNFPLTYGVSEIRDLTERKGTLSKSITLANTKNNAKLLNSYFDINVVAGTFDINKLQKCIVLEDNVPIVENAIMQLVNIKKVEKINAYDSEIEYTVLVKEASVDFFTKLGQNKLTDLNIPKYSHNLTPQNIINSFSNTYLDGYKYVMPQGDTYDNLFLINEFHPGIYARKYWDSIFQQSGYTYSWPSIDAADIQFSKLIIPFNGAQEDLLNDYSVTNNAVATGLIQNRNINPTVGIPTGSSGNFLLPAGTEVSDPGNHYNPTTYKYKIPFYFTSGNSLNVNVQFTYRMELINNSGATAYLVKEPNAYPSNSQLRLYSNVQLRKNTNPTAAYMLGNFYTPTVWNGTNGGLINGGTSFANGTTILDTGTANVDLNVPASAFTFNDDVAVEIPFNVLYTNNGIESRWRSNNTTGGTLVDVDYKMVITSFTVTYTPSIAGLTYNQNINVNNYIPREINQVDFIKAFVQLYNLFIDIDPNEPNKLIIKTRDEYYDSGKTVDWTKKLYKDKEKTISWLAATQKKRFLLTYKQDKDAPNTTYEANTKEIYGQQEFTYDNEFIKDTDKKEIIFSPTPVTKTYFGAIVPTLNGMNPKTNIRLLYDGGNFPCNQWQIGYATSTGFPAIQQNIYPLFSHFDKPTNPNFDINFGTCDYYYYNPGNMSYNNMYNLHWRRTLNQLNSGKMMTAYFNLNASDILKLELNDKIRIDNSYWNINQIIDYNPTVVGPTKVELISIDDELRFVPFRTKPVIGATPVDGLIGPIRQVNNDRNLTGLEAAGPVLATGVGNNILPGKGGAVLGKYNILSDNGFIIGDTNTALKSSMIIGDNNTSNEKALILGNDNTVQEGATNSLIVGNGFTVTDPNTIATDNIIATTINGVPTSSLITGLPGVLAIDNTTGPNAIVLNSGSLSPITSGSGNSNITMDAGIIDTMQLSQVSGTVTSTILFRPGNPVGVQMSTVNGSAVGSLRVNSTLINGSVSDASSNSSAVKVQPTIASLSSNDGVTSDYSQISSTFTSVLTEVGDGVTGDYSEFNVTSTSVGIGFNGSTQTLLVQDALIVLPTVPVTDNTNLKVLARNASTGNLEEVDVSAIVPGAQDLAVTLANGNTTGGNNIEITNGDKILNTLGGQIDFEYFGSPAVVMSNDNGAFGDSFILVRNNQTFASSLNSEFRMGDFGGGINGIRLSAVSTNVVRLFLKQNTGDMELSADNNISLDATNIQLVQTPSTVNTNTEILTRNSTTGDLELRDVSSLPSTGTQKYAATVNLAIGNNTITHSLGTADVQIQILDASGNLFIPNSVGTYATNSLVVNVSAAITSARVIIIG